jgi:hypothetical protein
MTVVGCGEVYLTVGALVVVVGAKDGTNVYVVGTAEGIALIVGCTDGAFVIVGCGVGTHVYVVGTAVGIALVVGSADGASVIVGCGVG